MKALKDFFRLTAVPFPHAGYVFIYVAFTTDFFTDILVRIQLG
jgi:hypothetical protein